MVLVGDIITQLAVYTTYIPLIILPFRGLLCYLPPIKGNQETPLKELFFLFQDVLMNKTLQLFFCDGKFRDEIE